MWSKKNPWGTIFTKFKFTFFKVPQNFWSTLKKCFCAPASPLTYIPLNGYDSITHEIFIVLPKCLVPTHSSAWTWTFSAPQAVLTTQTVFPGGGGNCFTAGGTTMGADQGHADPGYISVILI